MTAAAVLVIVGLLLAPGLLGAYVAAQKRRPKLEGFVLGTLFSWLGILLVLLLPTKEPTFRRWGRPRRRGRAGVRW